MDLKTLSLKYTLAGLLMFASLSVPAQKAHTHLDSLLNKLPSAKEDTNKVNLLRKLGNNYTTPQKKDSAMFYLQRSLLLAQKLKWQKGIIALYRNIGDVYYHNNDFANAYTYLNKAYELSFATNDDDGTVQLSSIAAASIYYQERKPDPAIRYLLAAADRFNKSGKILQAAEDYIEIGDYYQYRFNYDVALAYYNKGLQLAEKNRKRYLPSRYINQVANLYIQLHDVNKAKNLLLTAAAIYEKANDLTEMAEVYVELSSCYDETHEYDGAIAYYNKALFIAEKLKDNDLLASIENGISSDYLLKKDYDQAYIHLKRSQAYTKADPAYIIGNNAILGVIYRDAPDSVIRKTGIKPAERYDLSIALFTSAINYKHGLDIQFTLDNLKEISLTYPKMHRYADAFNTYRTYIAKRDSTDSLKNIKAVLLKQAQANYSHKEDSLNYKQNITNTQLKQKKQQSYFFIGGIAALVLLSLFITLNYNNQRKSNKLLAEANNQITTANHELSEQREEITTQRDQLVDTVANLKTAQQQLIQAEKMASLGELTAGIAHEIQNPLNFVNNFSDVNREMIAELKEALQTGNVEEALVIAADIEQNEEKIHHHGKRADNIVKGMLEHSRASTGQKELADLNKVADEYLRLAYHGLRAKDKSFNAGLITHFDQHLPPVNIIPQDIGRVLLNIFNNAFYATQQKKKTAGDDFKPEVTVTTLTVNNQVIIKVKDNGNGISGHIKDKIMQPFFTTKPTGEGTGLGLSLSYDIVVKVHGGKIDVNSIPGEGAEFIIRLPLS